MLVNKYPKNEEDILNIKNNFMAYDIELNKNEAIFKRPKHGDSYKEEVVNLLDFTCFKINDKKKDIFDVSFTVS